MSGAVAYGAVLLVLLALLAPAHGSVTPIQPGGQYSGHLTRRQWAYYSLPLQAGQTALFEVTSTGGDVDIYLRYNAMPQRYRSDAHNITTLRSFSLTFTAKNAGTHYVGLYGFSGAPAFRLSVSSEANSCPAACHGHGDCVNGHCVCAAGYAGTYCGFPVTALAPGVPTTVAVSRSYRAYVSLPVAAGDEEITFTVHGPTTYHSLYLRSGEVPTFFSYDARTALSDVHNTTQVVSFNKDTEDTAVYGMVFATAPISVTVQADIGSPEGCDNNHACSNHGSCSLAGGLEVCACDGAYAGRQCEWLQGNATLDTPYPGYVMGGRFNYYSISPSSPADLVISLTQANHTGLIGCLLYARRNAAPNHFQYDARQYGTGNLQLRLDDPDDASWVVAVSAFSYCDYSLTMSQEESCGPSNCVHGTCSIEGSCVCSSGFAGDQCDQSITTLSNGLAVQSSIARDSWKYFALDVPAQTTTIVAELIDYSNDTVGATWLFMNENSAPNLFEHSASDTSTMSNAHLIQSTFDDPLATGQTIYFGIYGNNLVPEGDLSLTSLVVYAVGLNSRGALPVRLAAKVQNAAQL